MRTTKTHVDSDGRICTKCTKYKLWNDFSISRKSKYWHVAICRLCVSINKIEIYMPKNNRKWVATPSKIKYWERKLNEVSWDNVEEKPYYDTSDIVQVWMSPFKTFFDKRNCKI